MWIILGISVGATKESDNSQKQRYCLPTISIHLPFAGGLRDVVGNKDGGNKRGQVHANAKHCKSPTHAVREYITTPPEAQRQLINPAT